MQVLNKYVAVKEIYLKKKNKKLILYAVSTPNPCAAFALVS